MKKTTLFLISTILLTMILVAVVSAEVENNETEVEAVEDEEEAEDEAVEDEEEAEDEAVEDKEEAEDEAVSPGFVTGLVTGFRPINPLNIVGLVVLLGLLGVYVFYRSFTIAGLSKRSVRLHKKADNLGKSGKYKASIDARRKARRLQIKADEKGYGK